MFFFFSQKTTYGIRISDWSSGVCSSDLDIIVSCELSDLQKVIYRRLRSLPDFHNARYYRRYKRCGCSHQPCKHKLPMLPDQSGLDERRPEEGGIGKECGR